MAKSEAVIVLNVNCNIKQTFVGPLDLIKRCLPDIKEKVAEDIIKLIERQIEMMDTETEVTDEQKKT